MNGRNFDPFSKPQSMTPLTEREQEVLACIGDGLSNQQIAAQLTVALTTVKWYVRQIFNKLNVENREQAVRRGRQLGLLTSATRPPHNLPPQPTPFVGRELELFLLAQYLAEPDTRLITIAGPGGMGKTQLALAAALAQVNSQQTPHPFAQGIYFVSLAGLATADLLVPTIAEAVGFQFQEGDSPQAQLLRFLAARAMLLVLDNFEHLLDGLPLLEAIGQTAPAVKLLVTSRTRLNLHVEQLLPLGGLEVPDEATVGESLIVDQLVSYSTIQLWEQCARRVQPGFVLTAENQSDVLAICRLVEGMPLGIVLAAAWLNALTPAEIAAEINRDWGFLETDRHDTPERQRSLRAAFNHSWRMLSQREQTVFAQLSVFRSGFERPAAQAVAEATLRDLNNLLNKSLLYRAANGRYHIHELLRQFVADQLAQSPQAEAEVRDRHSIYYCAFLHERSDDWHSFRQLDTLHAVRQEMDNIWPAWQWALDHGEWSRLVQAIDSWGEYHWWRGLYTQFEALCQTILQSIDNRTAGQTADNLRLRIKALYWSALMESDYAAAWLKIAQANDLLAQPQLADQDTRQERALILRAASMSSQGDLQRAEVLFAQGLASLQELDNQWQIALTLMELGGIAWKTCQYDLALEQLEAALAIQQRLGDQDRQAETLNRLGLVHKTVGQLEEAERLHRESLILSQLLDHRLGLVHRNSNLAHTLLWQGKFEEAQKLARHGVAICGELGYQDTIESWACYVLCDCLLHGGHYQQASQQAEQARSILEERTPLPHGHGFLYLVLGQLALLQSSYSQAQADLAQAYHLFLPSWGAGFTSLALAGLGHVAGNQGRLSEARQYLAQALEGALAVKAYITVVYILPFVAYFLATTGQVQRGVELWELAQTEPFVAHSKWFADVVGRELVEIAAALPPEAGYVARERSRALDLWATAELLLTELRD
jgi:predicted ATPase/DNA-binding CsgD family transcriptional regulator